MKFAWVPPGDSWIHELKYDGYRLELAVGEGVATAWTRNGKDWSDKFKALVKAAAKLPPGCLIDGEAVALDENGKPSFQLLQSTLKDRQGANLVFPLTGIPLPRPGSYTINLSVDEEFIGDRPFRVLKAY